ncbi:MAG: S28 family serine protease [Polyangiaceae bacterium]
MKTVRLVSFVPLFVWLGGCAVAPVSDSQSWSNGAVSSSSSAESLRTTQAADILDDLRLVPGVVEVTELASTIEGARFFFLRLEQPIDHRAPAGGNFTQRLTLIFRSREAPMVLATTGYDIPVDAPYQSEPAYLLNANQLLMEHRFFGESAPAPLDWTKLDIFQGAQDEHRVVQAFKPLFAKKWLTTGGSKGGMTAIYHRMFHPNDVDATVPYVAPTSFGRNDPRYVAFVENVGTADCRDKLKGFQQEILTRRSEIEPLFLADAAQYQTAYDRTGIHWAVDYAVAEAPFTFWQYGSADNCALIPARTATTDEIFQFLAGIYFGSVANSFSDAVLDYYAPYYYQAATELGGPGVALRHLRGLVSPGFRDMPQDLPPLDVKKPFNFISMPIVATWMYATAERMLLVYGENDPWSSGASTVRNANDSFRYNAPAGNHGSGIADLPQAEQVEAHAHLSRWMGVPIAVAPTVAATPGIHAVQRPFESLALWRQRRAERRQVK